MASPSVSEDKPVVGDDQQTPDDVLPQVTAPGAAFILQLFFIPLIIVLIIVMVWLMFTWLAHMGNDPHDLVRDIVKGDEHGWQQAAALADMLRNREYEHLKKDKKLAGALAGALQQQIDEGDKNRILDNRIKMRLFICKALGEFYVPEVLPALVKAASTQRVEQELIVRRSAIESIALVSKSVGPEDVRQNDELMQVLLKTTLERPSGIDENQQYGNLRVAAIFALGIIGGEQALDRLDRKQNDSYASARYNAAVGLARHGDARCIDVLSEMLAPTNAAAVAHEKTHDFRRDQLVIVQSNGIEATQRLADENSIADLSTLRDALENLATANVKNEIKLTARQVANTKEIKLKARQLADALEKRDTVVAQP